MLFILIKSHVSCQTTHAACFLNYVHLTPGAETYLREVTATHSGVLESPDDSEPPIMISWV